MWLVASEITRFREQEKQGASCLWLAAQSSRVTVNELLAPVATEGQQEVGGRLEWCVLEALL